MPNKTGSVTHGNADAGVDGEVVGTSRDVQNEGERSMTRRDEAIEGERPSALAHGQSTRAVENDQHHEENVDNVPEGPPDPPPPPDEPVNPSNEPPSIELEGERMLVTSSEDARTSDEADASGASGHVEDARKRPKKLHNASVHVGERLERRGEENSPGRAPEDPDEPGGETAAPGEHQDHRGCHEGDGKRRDDAINAPRRETGPGGQLGEQVRPGHVEDVWDRRNVVDSGGYDGIDPRSDENERVVETNALRRGIGPGGHRGEQEATGDVERDWKRQNVVEGAGYDGRWGRMDGATSGARCNSKRVGTRSLAEEQTSQHEQRKRTTAHVPRPPIPPPSHHRRPHTHPNPPRRRGRMKTRPTSVSNPRTTYQVKRASKPNRANRTRRIRCKWTGDGVGAIPDRDTRRRGPWSRSRTSACT